MTSTKAALMLAESALSLEPNIECGDATPSGRCNECVGCLNNAALDAVREVLVRDFDLGHLYPTYEPAEEGEGGQ